MTERSQNELRPDDVRADSDLPARSVGTLPVGELIFALAMVALGIYAVVGIFAIRVPVGAQVGPTVFPILVSAILLGSAVAVLIGLFRGQRGVPDDGEDIDDSLPTDWMALIKITAFVVAHLLLIEPLGWAPAAAVLFAGVAWTLGAKRWWMAVLIGVLLGVILQIVFAGFLGLSLPWGPLLAWIGGMF